MPYFEGSAARLFYLDEGDGPPLVFINGIIMSTSHWGAQTEAFRRDHRIIRYDQRCQGRSSVDRGFHYGALVDDLRELLDHLAIERATLCGISFGSFVAKEFAIRHLERCHRLVLAASMRRIDTHLRCVYDVWRALLQEGRVREFAESVSMLSYDRPWPALIEQNFPVYLDKFTTRTTGEQVLALLESFDDERDLSNHAEIRVPTLVLGATRDRVHPPDDSRAIAEAIPGAELTMLDASHALTFDRPEAVSERIRAFVDR